MGDPPSSRPLHVQTPLLKSRKLSEKAGATVWLKMETVQTSGSFKTRGLGNFAQKVSLPQLHGASPTLCPSLSPLLQAVARGCTRFVSSSGKLSSSVSQIISYPQKFGPPLQDSCEEVGDSEDGGGGRR